jgi:hypothetical protein
MLFSGDIDKKTSLLLLGGPLGCALAILVFLTLGFTRANYSSLKHPVSSLALEHLGWIESVSFMLSGILVFIFSFGLDRTLKEVKGGRWTASFIAAVGMGLIGAGIFKTDPVYGYPTHEPMLLEQTTLSGKLHELLSIFVFIGLPVAAFRFTRQFMEEGEAGWATYSLVSGIAVLVFLLLAEFGFQQAPYLVDFAGLFQRLSIIAGCTWLTLLAFYILGKEREKVFGV